AIHKNVGAAAMGPAETKPAICIEELAPPSWHAIKSDPTHSKSPDTPARRAGAWHNALLQAGPAPERAVMPIRILSQNPVLARSKAPVPLTRPPRRQVRAACSVC